MGIHPRRPLVIATLALGALLLSPNPATGPASPGKTPTAQVHDPGSRPAPPTFGFSDVRVLAQERAAHDFRPPPDSIPAELAKLSYDQYRDIRFRPESALWRGQSLFEVQFFHRGSTSRQQVNIFEISAAGVRPVPYNRAFFTFGHLLKPPKLSPELGFAGFRVHYPLQTPAYKDELITFLGASYFRVLGRNHSYGASARGLAIDTGLQSGEEFPTFTDFWLLRPGPNDRTLTLFALLDSKSVRSEERRVGKECRP